LVWARWRNGVWGAASVAARPYDGDETLWPIA